MLSGKRSLFVLSLFVLALAGFVSSSTCVFAQNKKDKKPKTIVVYKEGSPPELTLRANRSYVMACTDAGSPSGAQVELDAEAINKNQTGVGYLYHWTIKDRTGTNAGRIIGDGKHVIWDLSNLPPGTYNARVDVDTGRVDDCAAFTTTTVRVEPCPPVSCPTIVINCRDAAPVSGPVTFTANVSGIPASINPTYEWTVSAGTIRSGQGTRSIQVDTNGLAGQAITATLSVLGYDKACTATCSVQVPLLPLYPKKFDEFPNIKFDDEKARLDNFAIQLQSEPGAVGYILVYSGPRDRAGDAQKRADRAFSYLTNNRSIAPDRLRILIGGQRGAQTVELWLVPNGANPPTPTP